MTSAVRRFRVKASCLIPPAREGTGSPDSARRYLERLEREGTLFIGAQFTRSKRRWTIEFEGGGSPQHVAFEAERELGETARIAGFKCREVYDPIRRHSLTISYHPVTITITEIAPAPSDSPIDGASSDPQR